MFLSKKNQKNGYDLKKELSLDEQREVYNAVKKANKRIANIEKSGLHSYALDMIKPYFGVNNDESMRFSTSMHYKDLKAFKHMQSSLDLFLSSATSSVTGIKRVNRNRLNTFRKSKEEGGLGLEIKDEKLFFQFLSSQQFKMLNKYVDSHQLIEDYDLALTQGFTDEEIRKQYGMFLMSEMTFEQVAERRQRKVMLGKLTSTARNILK
jgi:hypothetical protein